MEVIVIGISGVTCGGKTMLATSLKKLIPDCIVFNQDNYYFDVEDSRHIRCNEVDHINFDVITSLDMERMTEDLKTIIGKRKLLTLKKEDTKQPVNAQTVNNILEKRNILLVVLDGFLLFAHQPLLPLISLKYFFTLSEEECYNRRIKREYIPADVPGYFEKCVWPEYLKHFEEVKESVKEITYFDGSIRSPVDEVLRDILNLL